MAQNRRTFLKTTALGTGMVLSIPEIVAAATGQAEKNRVKISPSDVILFQGDSITDVRRNRKELRPNQPDGLGSGYPFIAASSLLYHHPKDDLKIYNRGISGNKVFQLADRWETDCLDIKPDVLSILVGVNDFWHTMSIHYQGTVQTYAKDYKALLTRTKDRLLDVKLIIGEPYVLKGVKVVDDTWFPAFNEYREAAKEIARAFDAICIPYQEIYNKALELAPASYWSKDGVHPTLAGAGLMAEAWLKTVKG